MATGRNRSVKAAANLPASTTDDLFTIIGQVEILSLVGEVTTVIQTQANNTKISFTDTGTSTTTDMCAVLNITADPVGQIYTLTGVLANALQDGPGIDEGMSNTLILSAGTIKLDCAATNTGAAKWSINYRPLSGGARIESA